MTSELFEVLIRDRLDEVRKQYETKLEEKDEQIRQQEEKRRQEEEKRRQEQAVFQQELHQALEDTLLVRFPALPVTLARLIRRIQNPVTVRRLIVAVQQVPDLPAAEQLLQAAVAQEESTAE